MKQLILCLSLVMIMTISCKKQSTAPTVQKTSNSSSTTAIGAYIGTFVNAANINDEFILAQTTSAPNGTVRYCIRYYQYDKYTTQHDTIMETDLTTNPYHYTTMYSTVNGDERCQLYAVSTTVLKVQISDAAGTVLSTVTFNKQ